MKTVAILGSTGSIGKNALKVISRLKNQFKVVALAAGGNSSSLAEQVNKFRPRAAAIMDESKFGFLKQKANGSTKLSAGQKAIEEIAGCGADIVLMAISGNAALIPALKALEKSKRLALANKECLVMAGDIIIQKSKKHGAEIVPVDSEHSAIFQCLKDEPNKSLDKIYLTGSGGPLKDLARDKFHSVKPNFALRHPKWRMGRKISIDSATLINKGFEIIEANYLFGLPQQKIKVVIHPQALVHSLVQFCDGTILAQLGKADMRIPIQYALTYPERFPARLSRFDFSKVQQLSFQAPDSAKFPCLKLAMQAAKDKGLSGAVLSAADEECVSAYLSGEIKFTDIARIIEKVLSRMKNKSRPSLSQILEADKWAREQVLLCLAEKR